MQTVRTIADSGRVVIVGADGVSTSTTVYLLVIKCIHCFVVCTLYKTLHAQGAAQQLSLMLRDWPILIVTVLVEAQDSQQHSHADCVSCSQQLVHALHAVLAAASITPVPFTTKHRVLVPRAAISMHTEVERVIYSSIHSVREHYHRSAAELVLDGGILLRMLAVCRYCSHLHACAHKSSNI
eukprot:13851-Heterococcus_DN1.PRE.2